MYCLSTPPVVSADDRTTQGASTSLSTILEFAVANSVTEGNNMETLLSILSDLILLTAGLLVIIFWIALITVISIESYDFFKGNNGKDEDE